MSALEARLERAASRVDASEERLGATSPKLDRVETRVGASEVALRQAATDAERALAERGPGPAPAGRRPQSPPSAAPSASPSTDARPRPATTPPAPGASKPTKADQPQGEQPITEKLRDDWQTIKREDAASGDEIKKAFRDLWQKISR